jgi:hypothetical protein
MSNPTITSDQTLYAIFSKTIEVTFDANNSAGSDQIISCDIYNYDTTCSITAPSITA